MTKQQELRNELAGRLVEIDGAEVTDAIAFVGYLASAAEILKFLDSKGVRVGVSVLSEDKQLGWANFERLIEE